MTVIALFILIVLLMFLGSGIILVIIYNRLVTLKNRFKNAFAQIDVQLRRRYDLIPNIIKAAKTYLQHESNTLKAVIEARSKASSAQINLNGDPTQLGALGQLQAADSQLTSALGRLLVTMEAYPELKADKTISEVREELSSAENRIAFSRQAYNDAVMRYNANREKFPAVLFAEMFGFGQAEFWLLDDPTASAPPVVNFD